MTVMTPAPIDQQEDEEMLVPHSDLAENNHQPMDVVTQPETVSTVENQPVEDPPSSRFTWRIDNFFRLNTKKLYSDIFSVGGYKWRVLIFPKGNNVDHLSMYLDVADSASLPYGWSRYAQFSLCIVNQIHNKYSVRKDTQHQFNARESDWGFTSFMPLSELYDPSRGYLLNDTLIIEAEVLVRRVVDYWTYDSKKETGFVGLKNQGATCYMNSLLQTLFHIPYFRKAVYHMPTTENDLPSASIPLALQSLFYKLQYSDNSVATKELTKSFGWDTYDSFMQHDVQELNRVLSEKLEDKMKGTVVEGTIQKLFEGHHMNYIECINVDYKSTRKESFYDLQLDVKGCRDVYASFDKYVEVERLEGDNKYHAEQYELQDAKKGVLFIDFPPVLQLQLKRFEYDFMRDTMVKINDRYEFPLQLDLDRENGKYLSPDADRSVRNLYMLHSVLVHSGGVHGGHYYAFIRPTLGDQWYKFDDERVTKEDMKRALEEQYGGEEELPQTTPGFNNAPFKFTKYSNAYMLVYIRESDKDKIICNVDEKDIAEHLRERLKKEQEEKEHKKKEKAEAHLYTIIKVARDEDLTEQIGRDIYFDLVDHEKVRSFRIQKQMPFNLFKEEVARDFGIPVQFQRFWLWAKRQNHTYRPNRPLTPMEETQTVGQLREVSNKVHNAELKLFLEVEHGLDLCAVAPPDKTKDDILLFFKLYDPEKEELRYVGRLFVKGAGKAVEILTKLNEMAGYAPDEDIELYEEIKFEPSVMCESIERQSTFRANQLEDGDIICFQKSSPAESGDQFRYPDVPSFLDYVYNRQVVHFRALDKPKEDDFRLEMSKQYTYDDVVERVALQLGLDDPSKIRLTPHNCYSQQPKPQPIKYRGVERLTDMLVHYNQTSDILYYEVLDIPLPELQGLKTLKVAFHHATKDEVVVHTIRLPKQSTVGDVINDLKTKVELSHPNAELRLLEVFYHKIYKVFPPNEKIENINDQYWTLRAEEIIFSSLPSGRSTSQMLFRADYQEFSLITFLDEIEEQRLLSTEKLRKDVATIELEMTILLEEVGQLREVSNKVHNAELKLFLEVEHGLDLCAVAPPDKTKDDILLFFKLYDPEKEELRYVGRLFVKGAGKAVEILTKLNEMAGYAPDEDIELYEEIKFEPSVMCESIERQSTFRANQLEDGDIICFQKSSPAESGDQFRYPDVPSFLDYVYNRQVVHFRALDKPKEDDFRLEMSKQYTYDDVVERVALQLGLDDPSKIRLTPHNCYSQQPKPQPIKYRGVERLTDMLVHYNQTSDILYYEVLDIPLPELQGLKTLKVAFHHATKDEVVVHTIRLPKQSTVGDVINDLKTKVELSHPNAELRLLEVFYHKIYKVFPPNEKIENINDQYWTLRAEEIPEEEKNLGPHDRLIHVYHFTKDTAQNQMQIQNFGEPFFLVIHEGETLAEIKVRLQKKLQVPDEEFAKWKFAFLSLGRPEYLQDSDIVSNRFQRRDVYGAWEQYLGLEHSDSTPKRAYTANQNRHAFEKPVKIYN
ncbi:ubiquitin C-terminal hydrolase 12-like [Corylus avellana]|uniref:ubiquitin C-terminal hydrolase 12-like n=1 Tax=Corylus avellana TaxID=13451 RepID=UPI00286B5BA8|nr:ubiquitin C-terminal hydrolase 12-like [Corylus avellana]